ncbi:carboxymuconolactone decarboxylase family protein [Gaiella sp.]|uniref:carboxymuconolactone decarboxylase family protein n=1 Tax=Gaiella sp. TaxID=2663207 RepID=UPI003263500C
MPHIRLTEPDEASGLLASEYDAAIGRAGKIFNIVKAMSPRPETLQASMAMYKTIMFGPSGLSRAERELLATVTSSANDCHY